MNEKNKSIIAIMLIIITLSGIYLYWGISRYQHSMDVMISDTVEKTALLIHEVMKNINSVYDAKIDILLQDPVIITAFYRRDRSGLYNIAVPKYQALKQENHNFSNIHFHLPNGFSFLRVHKPDEFGDDLRQLRPIVMEVHRTRQPSSGYEIGKHGLFYRVVKPVFFESHYIGALEFGILVDEFAEHIQDLLGVRVGRYINDSLLNDEFRKFCTNEIRIGPFSMNPYSNKELFQALMLSGDLIHDTPQNMNSNGLDYLVYNTGDLKNYKGEVIARLLIVQNITGEIKVYQTFVIRSVMLTLLLVGGAYVVLNISFGTMLNKIIELNRTLEQKVLNRTRDLEMITFQFQCANAELDKIFNTAADGMRVIGRDYRVHRVNDTFSRIAGIPKEDLENRLCHENFKGVFCFTSECTLKRILDGDSRIEMDVKKKNIQGEERSFLLTATPLKSPDGEILGVVENFKDMTERERTARALQESEQRYRLIAEHTSDVIWTSDIDLTMTYVSPSVEKLRGYTVEQDMALALDEKYTAPSLEILQQAVSRIRHSSVDYIRPSEETLELETLHRDGYAVPVEVILTPVWEHGKLMSFHGVSRDISKRKFAFDMVKENEKYLKTIMTTVHSGVIVIDAVRQRVLDANPYALKLLGCNKDELLNAMISKFFNLPPNWIEAVLSPGRDPLRVDNCIVWSKQGKERNVRLSAAQANVRGEPHLVLGFVDITDMNRLLEKQVVDIHKAKKIMALINRESWRYLELPQDRRLFFYPFSVPCNAEGGDHYFICHGNDGKNLGLGRTLISVKDQSGHEVNCILRSIYTDLLHHAVIASICGQGLDILMERLNNELCRSDVFEEDDFFTSITIAIDHETLALSYVSAGHPPFLFIRNNRVRGVPGIDQQGLNLPIPFLENRRFSLNTLQLQEGDQLILYTDGLMDIPLKHHGKGLSVHELISEAQGLIDTLGSTRDPETGTRVPVGLVVEKLLEKIAAGSREKVVDGRRSGESRNTSLDDITILGIEVEAHDPTCERLLQPQDQSSISRMIHEVYDQIIAFWDDDTSHLLKERLRMVLEEAILNAWKHGNKKDPEKIIRIRWHFINEFILEVIDQGQGFDYDNLSDPTLDDAIFESTGRGIFIIRSFSEHVLWKQGGRHIVVFFGIDSSFRKIPEAVEASGRINLWCQG